MRIMKATVVTTGAVAALAAMGASPVFAAATTPAAATHATEVAKSAADQLWQQDGVPGWSAPWDAKPAPLVSILDGAVINLLPWQLCGSTAVAGVGGAVPVDSPNTVLGDCNNANTAVVH